MVALVAVAAVAAFVVLSAPGAPRGQARRPGALSAGARSGRRTRLRLAPGPELTGAAARHVRVPILMYHVISAPPAGTPYPDLWVPPSRFAAQVRALAAAGYHGVTLAAVLAAWNRGAPLPRRPLVLSFDDGYSSDASHAAPVLRRLGWPGVLNLEIRNAGPGGISMAALHRLVHDGWEIDSHTVDHPDLTTLPPARLRAELVRSRAWIRRRLGAAADLFAYPAGRFNPAVVAAVRAAGYRAATTELPGPATPRGNRFELPRIRMSAATQVANAIGG